MVHVHARMDNGFATENHEEVDRLRRRYADWLQPQNSIEEHCVLQMVAGQWQEMRAWAIEAAGHDIRMSRQYDAATEEFPKVGIYLTQVTPTCSMGSDGGVSTRSQRVRDLVRHRAGLPGLPVPAPLA